MDLKKLLKTVILYLYRDLQMKNNIKRKRYVKCE